MNPAPRGQILPIVGVAMIVLLGVAALVIDLGFSWVLLRHEQNAVDPASVAAARYLPDSNWTEAYTAACFYVQEHGFFEDDDATCSTARAAGDLYVGTPRFGDYAGDTGAVEVAIEATHPAFFGRIFGQETASVSTYAVAANGATGVGNVNANSLVAFDPASCGAGQINGNGEVNITNSTGDPGGFVYVNSLCGIDPPGGSTNDICDNAGTGGLTMNGNPSSLSTEHVYVRGTCDTNPGPWDGDTTEGAPEITDGVFGLVEPSIVGQPEWGRASCPMGGTLLTPGPGCSFTRASPIVTLSPGVYYGGIVVSGQAKVQLNPGVYYIAGGGIQYQGNSNSSFDVIGGTGGNPGRALFFSTGDPTYAGICALDPTFPQNSPPQFGPPDGDLTFDGAWLTELDAPGTYTAIADLVGDATADVTFLKSPSSPTAPNHFEVSLADIVPPIPDSGIFVRYRYGKPAGSTATINLEVELLQGTTVIASKVESNIPSITPWLDGSFELTTANLAAITDWTDLRLNFKATSTGGSDPNLDRALVSWAQLQIPAIESRRCQGMIRLAGQADVTAWATDVDPWGGLLMWQDGTLTGNGKGNNPVAMINIQGNGEMDIAGTIYAPKALVKIAGNGVSDADTAAVQVLAWQFQIGGNGVLNMPYDPDQFFGTPESAQKGLVE